MNFIFSIASQWRSHCRSISVRLLAFGLALAVVGSVARFAFVSTFLKDEVLSMLASHQISIATYVANDIDEKIKARLALLQRTAAALPTALLSDPPALRDWIHQRQQVSPLFNRGIVVVPLDHHLPAVEYPAIPGRGAIDFSTADWYRAAVADLRPVVGHPLRSRIDQKPIIIMAAPVLDANGRPIAVLSGVTEIGTPGFLNLVQENRVGRTGGFLLISPKDKMFIAANDPAMVLMPTPPAGINPLHDRAMAGFRGADVTTTAKGKEELSAIASVPSTGWFLVARLPTEEAFEPIRHVKNFVITNSFILLGVISVVVLVVMRRILRPLRDAAHQMHLMADGRIPLAPLPVASRDEVGQLAQGFNYLLTKLSEQEEALRESEARMAHLAHHDPLTGLPNRIMFNDRLQQAIIRAERGGAGFALMYLDLDGFKPINDTHGHSVGDVVLRQVARRLSTALRKADTVARIGGDEFAILLMEQPDARVACESVLSKCQEAMAEPFEVDGLYLTVSASIGFAVYPEHGRDANDLIRHADHAMYRVKRSTPVPARVV